MNHYNDLLLAIAIVALIILFAIWMIDRVGWGEFMCAIEGQHQLEWVRNHEHELHGFLISRGVYQCSTCQHWEFGVARFEERTRTIDGLAGRVDVVPDPYRGQSTFPTATEMAIRNFDKAREC